jgi:tRNA-splicing ligase RtcB
MDYSYILRPRQGAVASGYSVNHGAGRRLSRGDAIRQLNQARIDRQYREAGILVNVDGRVPLDEAAPAYKSAEEVVRAVTEAGLAKIEHRLWPLSSLKGTEGGRRGRAKSPDRKTPRKRSSEHY